MTRSLVVFGFVLLAGSVAGAQSAPAKRSRIGHAASPPPEQVQPQLGTGQYAPPIYYENGYGVVAAPFVVLADGSVLANFGNGYERVLRACSTGQRPTQANVNGRDALGRILPPVGIATLQQGTHGQIYGQVPQRNVGACYRIDGRGRAEVQRQ
jgi:hypothetical protein